MPDGIEGGLTAVPEASGSRREASGRYIATNLPMCDLIDLAADAKRPTMVKPPAVGEAGITGKTMRELVPPPGLLGE